MISKTITVDFSNDNTMPTIKANQGDALSRVYHLKLVAGSTAVDLTGCTVRAHILPFGETSPLYEDCTITGITTGKVDYTMSGNACAVAGTGLLVIEVIETGAPDPLSTLYSKEIPLQITVKRDFTGAIEASTAFSALQSALAAVANILHTIGDETVNGVKTFTSSPIVPTPTTDMQASTKKYVDDEFVERFSENSFTPALQFGGAAVGMTYSIQLANYIKIGKLVMCDVSITLSAKGSSVGSAVITGLPFSCAVATSVGMGEMLNIGVPTAGINPFAVISGTTLVLRANRAGSTQIDYADTEFANNSKIRLSFCYRTT